MVRSWSSSRWTDIIFAAETCRRKVFPEHSGESSARFTVVSGIAEMIGRFSPS
jgi:hypothetical protein